MTSICADCAYDRSKKGLPNPDPSADPAGHAMQDWLAEVRKLEGSAVEQDPAAVIQQWKKEWVAAYSTLMSIVGAYMALDHGEPEESVWEAIVAVKIKTPSHLISTEEFIQLNLEWMKSQETGSPVTPVSEPMISLEKELSNRLHKIRDLLHKSGLKATHYSYYHETEKALLGY